MINKRNNSYKICIVCVLSIVILVFLYFCKKIDYLKIIYKLAKETKIKDVVNIVAILSGISGVLIGVSSGESLSEMSGRDNRNRNTFLQKWNGAGRTKEKQK